MRVKLLGEAAVAEGVTERACSFMSGGRTLRGVLSLPAGDAKSDRGVVIIHGWGTYRIGPHAMLVKLARRLARSGCPALRFDLSGRGESGGRYEETGLDEMIEDAAAAAAELARESNATALGAMGLCSGANVALASAALDGTFDRIVAVSLLPYQSHRSTAQAARGMAGRFAALGRKALSPATWWRLVTWRVNVGRVAANLAKRESAEVKTANGTVRNLKDSSRDVMAALARFRGSALMIWGGADAEGLGAKAHFEAFARRNSLDWQMRVVAGANHNFYSLAWEEEVIVSSERFLCGKGD
jgi:hypothetical protein